MKEADCAFVHSKAWRNVIECKDHPHLFVSQNNLTNSCPKPYTILELGATDAAATFVLPDYEHVHSSVDGLVLLCGRESLNRIFLCNPITREYLRLPNPPRHYCGGNIGFGTSMNGQYKLVRISLDNNACHVYTLGTGQWRRAARGPLPSLRYERDSVSASVNGSIYWVVNPSEGPKPLISCFDLETEEFASFPAPPDLYFPQYYSRDLSVLEDRLCFFDHSIVLGPIIWTMKGRGCWTKEFVVRGMPYTYRSSLFTIKVFRDGDMLLGDREHTYVFYYSKETKTVEKYVLDGLGSYHSTNAVAYTPSFRSLKTLVMDIGEEEMYDRFFEVEEEVVQSF